MIERALRPSKSEIQSISGRVSTLVNAGLLPLSEARVEELWFEAATAQADFDDFLRCDRVWEAQEEVAAAATRLMRAYVEGKLREIRLQLAMDALARRRRARGRPRLPYPVAELAQRKAEGLSFREALERLTDAGVVDPDNAPSTETLRRRWREIP